MLYNKKAQPLSEEKRKEISRSIDEQLTKNVTAYQDLIKDMRKECKDIAAKNKESISLKSDILNTPFI